MATFSHTNPLNISEILTATNFNISMLHTSNLVFQFYIFFLLFPFLVFAKYQVLNLSHMTHYCKSPMCPFSMCAICCAAAHIAFWTEQVVLMSLLTKLVKETLVCLLIPDGGCNECCWLAFAVTWRTETGTWRQVSCSQNVSNSSIETYTCTSLEDGGEGGWQLTWLAHSTQTNQCSQN